MRCEIKKKSCSTRSYAFRKALWKLNPAIERALFADCYLNLIYETVWHVKISRHRRNNSAYFSQNVSVLHSWLSTTQNKQRLHKLKALFAVGAKHIKIFPTWIETNLTRRGESLRIFWLRTADHWQMNKRFYSSI